MPPQQTDLRRTILNSNADAWEFIDVPQTWVLWEEMLTIETVGIDGVNSDRSINQPDFASLPDPDNDIETAVRVMYKGTPFDHLPVLGLDGGRIRMIKPNRDSNGVRHITEYEAQLSEIMSMDDFMSRQGNAIDVEIRNTGV